MSEYIFARGPVGRDIRVDEFGRLLVTPGHTASGYVYAYGDTGYALAVDSTGRLLVNPSGFDAALSGNYYGKDEHLISAAADTYDVGGSSDRFNTVWANSGNFADGLSVNGVVVDTSDHPIEADAVLFRNLRIPDYLSMKNKTGAEYNVALGWQALENATNPLENVAVGYKALQTVVGGEYNIGIGSNAGNMIDTGDYNICIGWNSDVDDNDQQRAVAIGYFATASGDNQIRLGDQNAEVHCENLMVQSAIQARTIETRVVIQPATSGAYTVDFSVGHLTRITLDGDIVFTLSNAFDGQKHIIQIKQDASGDHTATWPSNVRWPDGIAPTLTVAASGVDYIGFIYDGDDGTYDGLAESLNLQ